MKVVAGLDWHSWEHVESVHLPWLVGMNKSLSAGVSGWTLYTHTNDIECSIMHEQYE